MRKAAGVLAALALVIPAGIYAMSPAGAANTVVPKCKSFTGTQTYKPGLPPTSSTAKVKPTTTTKGTFTGCKGGGITKGTVSGTIKAKVATNCQQLFKDAAAKKPGTPTPFTVKWSNGQTTSGTTVVTVTGVSGNSLKATVVGKATKGLGKGHTTTIQVLATPNKGWCNTAPLSKVTFKSTKITYK